MLFSLEQAFVGRDEKRAPLKTPAWEAKTPGVCGYVATQLLGCPNPNPIHNSNP